MFKSLYKRALADDYEGLMLKVADAIYEPGYNNYHSRQMIKIKELFREEFLISGYKTGKGRDEHKLTLVCKLTQSSVTKALEYLHMKNKPVSIDPYAAIGFEFKVKPALDDIEAKKFYEEVMSGEVEIIGKLYTVEFRDWSDKFIPQQPVGKAIFN
jgi:ATP-dependent DNA ligase